MCRSKSIKAIDVFVDSLDLFWTIEIVREVWVQKGYIYFHMDLSCFW
jgi:hypothetical protein